MSWTPADRSIWGGLLPFVGFRTIAVNENGDPVDPTAPNFNPHRDYDTVNTFCIGWFGYCLLIRSPFQNESK